MYIFNFKLFVQYVCAENFLSIWVIMDRWPIPRCYGHTLCYLIICKRAKQSKFSTSTEILVAKFYNCFFLIFRSHDAQDYITLKA